jgi:hypothetical protein
VSPRIAKKRRKDKSLFAQRDEPIIRASRKTLVGCYWKSSEGVDGGPWAIRTYTQLVRRALEFIRRLAKLDPSKLRRALLGSNPTAIALRASVAFDLS